VERFRSDAKAEGENIVIGGWEVADAKGRRIAQHEARWFQVTLDRVSAPWAYRRGEPFRVIAALELLGTILAVKLFLGPTEKEGSWSGKLSAGASTDNQGNRFVVNRFMTTKFPLLAFVCELATLLEERSCLVDVGWVPRDQNEEADAITNGDIGGFDKDKEVEVVWDFVVLDKLLDLGDKFYAEVQEEKARAKEDRAGCGAKVAASGKRKRKAGLKVTDPW